jgi:hypothetical protein
MFSNDCQATPFGDFAGLTYMRRLMKQERELIVLTCIGRFAESENTHSYVRRITPLLKERRCSEYGFNNANVQF